jgi:DNA processing protein
MTGEEKLADLQTVKLYISLKTIKGISDNTIISAVKKYGNIEKVLNTPEKELKSIGFRSNQIESLKRWDIDKAFIESEMKKIKKYNIDVVLYEEERYPELLKEINQPPSYLYTYGNTEILTKPSIAIVGARRSSDTAREFTQKLAKNLAEVGFNIVSGFAAGIDINAHLGAVKRGTTTAVFGNGLLKLYPGTNKRYINKIIKNGCLISEFPLEEEPLATNFPRRNRIISGLSLGVVVVEASAKSGSLITARYAIQDNREVFAVPTWPENFNSETNKLIKQGAKLTENYMDIVEEFASFVNFSKMVDNKDDDYNINFDSNEEKNIYNILKLQPMSIDEICMKSGVEASAVLTLLSEMEIKGIIRNEVDGKYSIRRN